MKSKHIFFPVLSLFVLITITGCYQKLEVITVEDFSDVQVGLKGLRSNLDVSIYNPNFYPIELSKTEITLRVRDYFFCII